MRLSGGKLTEAPRMSVLLYGYIHGEGGIQTHTRYLAEGLRARGHSVQIISPAPMIAHDHSEERLNGGLEYGTYRSVRDLVRAIRSGGPDVIVIVGTGWKAMAAALMARRPCKKIFFEVMSGARNSGLDPRSLVNFGFDAVVGQGSSVTRRFAKEFGWKGQTTTIPALPEPLESFGPIPRRSLRDTTNGIRFAHFGRLAEHKNVALLVDRFKDYAPAGSILDIWGGERIRKRSRP